MEILDRLLELRDEENARFQAKLTPGVPEDRFLGVRVPKCRALAKEIMKEGGWEDFLSRLPNYYFDENMLHAILISQIKDYDECIRQTEIFLPYVDNWAVCDTISPKVFAKHKDELIVKIREWAGSEHTYTCRLGIRMLMSHFLDGDFRPEYLEIPAAVRSDEYYVNMMTAWFFATALAKQWENALPYLEQNRLDEWTHNKTIQKAKESYRITPEQKAQLSLLKRGN